MNPIDTPEGDAKEGVDAPACGLMGDPQNIQCFNAACRLVLAKLYGEFPRPCAIDAGQIMNEMPEYCRREWGPFHRGDNYVAATTRFLIEEGFIYTPADTSNRQTVFPGARLTSKGFAILAKPLAVLEEPSPTIGQRLKENLSIGDVATVVSGIIQAGVGLLGR